MCECEPPWCCQRCGGGPNTIHVCDCTSDDDAEDADAEDAPVGVDEVGKSLGRGGGGHLTSNLASLEADLLDETARSTWQGRAVSTGGRRAEHDTRDEPTWQGVNTGGTHSAFREAV